MMQETKVLYLKKSDGRSIKTYVVNYLLDITTNKKYVIIVDQNGKNAKGFEVVGDQAVILSAKDIGIFKGYLTNPKFQIITSSIQDGMSLELVKEIKSQVDLPVQEETKIEQEIVKEELAKTVEPSESIVEIHPTELKANYMEESKENFEDQTTSLEQSSEETPLEQETDLQLINSPKETSLEKVNIYVYDQNVLKKYSAQVLDIAENQLQLREVKAIETIPVSEHFNSDQFLNDNNMEVGSYYVDYSDFHSKVENENERLVVNALMTNFICKTQELVDLNKQDIKQEKVEVKKQDEVQEAIEIKEQEEVKKQDRVLVFHGNEETYDGKNHYSIWGCFCAIIEKKPFTISPEKNGVKTIIFEDKKASSVKELCQIYQNLYPTYQVYLLQNGNQIIDGTVHIFQDQDYITFQPQVNLDHGTLLNNGKKILTNEEMEEKRKKDLRNLKKKKLSDQNKIHSIADEYLKYCPNDIAFASYIRSLEYAGVTEDHMKATGFWNTIQDKMQRKDLSNMNDGLSNFGKMDSQPTSIKLLSQSFRKHFAVVKGVNDDILFHIEEMERLGHTPEQIIEELHLPTTMVQEFRKDFPSLNISKKQAEKKGHIHI